jgi:hypothetical protein
VRDGSVLATRVLHPLEQPLRLGGGQLAVEERQVDLLLLREVQADDRVQPVEETPQLALLVGSELARVQRLAEPAQPGRQAADLDAVASPVTPSLTCSIVLTSVVDACRLHGRTARRRCHRGHADRDLVQPATAENHLFASEIADERAELADHPEIEQLELEILLREEGLDASDARSAAEIISRSTLAHLKTKVEKELGLPYGENETALGDALVVGGMYALAAAIPLWPYFFWGVGAALPVSLVATALALFGLGLVKGRVTGTGLLGSGAQVLLVGGASAAIGWLIGAFVPGLV